MDGAREVIRLHWEPLSVRVSILVLMDGAREEIDMVGNKFIHKLFQSLF